MGLSGKTSNPPLIFISGTLLAARGKNRQAVEWLRAGALNEEDGLFSSTFLLGFLERHNGQLIMPALAFEDPRPFIHFANVPVMMKARSELYPAGRSYAAQVYDTRVIHGYRVRGRCTDRQASFPPAGYREDRRITGSAV